MMSSQLTAVMLTPDRQIDRRILLQADCLERAGWKVTIIAMPLDETISEDERIVRIGQFQSKAIKESFVLSVYRWTRAHLPMNGALMRLLKRIAWRYFVNREAFYIKLFDQTVSGFSPSVFVAHDLPMLPIAAKAAHSTGAKLLYDSHELYTEQEFSRQERQQWSDVESSGRGGGDDRQTEADTDVSGFFRIERQTFRTYPRSGILLPDYPQQGNVGSVDTRSPGKQGDCENYRGRRDWENHSLPQFFKGTENRNRFRLPDAPLRHGRGVDAIYQRRVPVAVAQHQQTGAAVSIQKVPRQKE